MRSRLALSATLAALALLAIAPGASAVTRAQGTITAVPGQANTYVLTVDNTGNETIQCMRFFAPAGVNITAVSPPATQESSRVFSAGPGVNIAPGNSRNFSFRTQAPYPTNGGGTLNVSSTCSTGSDVSSQVTGPAGAVAPPDPRCKCSGLTARLVDPSIRSLHGRSLGFKVRWKLTCTKGTGTSCRGRIKMRTSPRDVKFTKPKSKVVRCKGKCGASTTRRSSLSLLFSKRLRPLSNASAAKRRAHDQPYPRLRISLDFYCLDADGKETRVGRRVVTVKFDRYGQVNRKTSDLNGDGSADGRRR